MKSATCREVPGAPLISEEQQITVVPEATLTVQSQATSASPDPQSSPIQHLHPCQVTQPLPQPKSRLKLPSSEEEWDAANSFFAEFLVPSVLNQSSADSKHAALTEGIYDYFAGIYIWC